jgi:hypothetical protein
MEQPYIPDSISEHMIRIALADESQYGANTEERRQGLYAAHFEDGSALDVQDTITVIGILALIADKAEGM